MAPTTHSELGASKASRWMACPGSVREAREWPEPESSEYAIEGTHAHTLGERALRERKSPTVYVGDEMGDHDGTFVVTQEMAEAVEVYYDTVMADLAVAGSDAILFVERRFWLSHIHLDLYGTNDAAIYVPATGLLIVYDYKHGQGVAVEVERNPQLLYYGAGAVGELGAEQPVKAVRIVVVQPRCPHPGGSVRPWDVDMLELLEWEADLADAVARAEEPDAPLAAGDHCRWCPAAPGCPEMREHVGAAAQGAFEMADLEAHQGEERTALAYDPDELAAWLGEADLLETWIKRVREFAYQRANSGEVVPGFKLVEKQGRAKWTDETGATELLTSYGYEGDSFFNPPKLRTPAQVRTALKKDPGTVKGGKRGTVRKEVEGWIETKSSGTALVPESDKRPAVTPESQAQAAFAKE